MKKFLASPVDWFILFIPILLTITGIITIYTITFVSHHATLALSQLYFGLGGLVALIVLMFADYRSIKPFALLIFIAGLLLLLPLLPLWAAKLPFVLKVFGAHRWLDFGFFQFQPAEVFKLIAIIFSAKYLSEHVGRLSWQRTVVYFFLVLGSFSLVLLQPDLGSAAVLLVIFVSIFLAARPSWKIIGALLLVALLAIPLLWSSLRPYQKNRLETFLNPSNDPQGQGYNVRQALIAVGSGGLLGRGFGQGSQTVLNFLPVPHADFIFAGYAEATGFVGSFALVVLYIVLLIRVLDIAKHSNDPFGQLLAVGIASKLFFQMIVHVGMNIGLLPVTGIPLPFMSYGGTALIIDLASIGLLESINIRHKKIVFS